MFTRSILILGFFILIIPFAWGGSVVQQPPTPVITMSIDNVELMQPAADKYIIANFPIRLSQPAFNVTVDYMTRDVTATAGIDYEFTRGRIKFLPFTNLAYVPVRVLNNAQTVDMNRDFEVVLSNAVNARIIKGVGSGMIFQQGLFFEHFSHTTLPQNWMFKGTWMETHHCLMGTPIGFPMASAYATPVFSGCKNCTVLVGIESGMGGSISFYPWYASDDYNVEVVMNEAKDTWTLKQTMHGNVVAEYRLKSPIEPGVTYNLALSNNNGIFRLTLESGLWAQIAGIDLSGTVGIKAHGTIAEMDYLFVK